MRTQASEKERMDYETAPGRLVSSQFAEVGEVPIPKMEVRRKANLPERLAYASLAEEVQPFYQEVIPPKVEEYVRHWPQFRQIGQGFLLAGLSGAGKSWAAAALVNELHRTWMYEGSIRTHWFSVPMGMRRLLDHRHFKNSEEYHEQWGDLTSCDLLVVDDLLHVSDFPQAKEYLVALYHERDERGLPIVTTCNAIIAPDDWTAISKVFDEPFMRRLRANSTGFTLVLSK